MSYKGRPAVACNVMCRARDSFSCILILFASFACSSSSYYYYNPTHNICFYCNTGYVCVKLCAAYRMRAGKGLPKLDTAQIDSSYGEKLDYTNKRCLKNDGKVLIY